MTQQYIIKTYTFDPATRTIALPTEPNLTLEGIQLITNLTTGTLIYQFNNVALGGTVSGNTVTLTYDTTTMSSTDKLQILYNPPRGGFFDSAFTLLYRISEYLRAPSYMRKTAAGDSLGVIVDSGIITSVGSLSTVSSVTTVSTVTTLNNFNSMDSRYIIWSGWNVEFQTGIRNRIT
jgi:hypothetical protein